jgi:DNA polymerase III alpha subunit
MNTPNTFFNTLHFYEDFPNSLSIHARGIMISEEPLSNYTALQPMPKGFPICQFDMYVAEDIGFAKFDVLSQLRLGHIKTAVDIVKENRGVDIDIHAIQKFKNDENIRRQLQNHETMGVFLCGIARHAVTTDLETSVR